jgi:Holliday junction resolvase RusA-like endonuclease
MPTLLSDPDNGSLTLIIDGDPAPKGSYRALMIHGKSRLIPMSKREHKWRKTVAEACKQSHVRIPPHTPVEAQETYYLKRPKTVKRNLPTVPPDIDKLERCLHDGITDSGLWDDDSRLVKVEAEKVYITGDPKVIITLHWHGMGA